MTWGERMKQYRMGQDTVDSVELKCMVVSRGVKVDREVYRRFARDCRLSVSPLECNCFFLSDGTVVQMTDMGFHLKYLTGILSWDNLKLLRYASELGTPFAVKLEGDKPALFFEGALVDFVSFPPPTDFYRRKTASGLPFAGNAVIQGLDWVAFQCLWPCEYAAAGEPCEFCFSGGAFQADAARGKPMSAPLPAKDAAEIARYGFERVGLSGVQITGGSTFAGESESALIRGYLEAIGAVKGETLLYITPPKEDALIDDYFALGASRVACSLELWDEKLAARVTPGKIRFTTRERHIAALEHAAKRHGPGKAFSNFIIGIEPFESLAEGASFLSERGILPSASVWMPMGRPVLGSMKAPPLDFFRRVKEHFAEQYTRNGLVPAGERGLNVCVERDIYRYATGK